MIADSLLANKKTVQDGHFIWSTSGNGNRTSEILESLYRLLVNYQQLQSRLGKMKLTVENILKPESISEIEFLF